MNIEKTYIEWQPYKGISNSVLAENAFMQCADTDTSPGVVRINFAASSVSAGLEVGVKYAGIDINQTSLTPESTYYLSDTFGDISTSAGTNSIKVGKAISATELFIIRDN